MYPGQHDRPKKIQWVYSLGLGCIDLVLVVVGVVPLKGHSGWLQLAGGEQWSSV